MHPRLERLQLRGELLVTRSEAHKERGDDTGQGAVDEAGDEDRDHQEAVLPPPKDISGLYERMSGKGGSASEAYLGVGEGEGAVEGGEHGNDVARGVADDRHTRAQSQR